MKLSEQAYQKLKTMILNNEFRISQQLLVEDAVEICGFSRTPVREALLRLQADGLIKLHPRHGLRICALSKKDLQELYELIAHLEVTAIELCIQHQLSDAQINTLREYTKLMNVALEKDDIFLWADYDRQFHEEIFEYTGNSRLIETAKKYNEQNKRCKDIVIKLRPLPWDSIAEHNKLVDAIEKGDALGARKMHLEHWREVSKQFIGFLDNYHFLDS
ncbi:GntR family transcriptional regulator [Photobacterium sp. DNB23_23_1]|uniref:GntR family transcriptional regulator n=1 Tax=Photobacterium pectinilyticum TaxID=2906793 RepID=A0ABT1N4X8_9GAMM|nr:GntR family transcriptional regulator [Photobacterium sp. ZSDE20]MCQ1059808.1 GntR family transcriptional regulator [Photobacterium sp. ZSDE20]MDD1826135.1 GntR family transcriptional regulator [Photobacterium sp. ZSDE20]